MGCTPYATGIKDSWLLAPISPGQENIKCLKMRIFSLQGGHSAESGYVQCEYASWIMVETTV